VYGSPEPALTFTTTSDWPQGAFTGALSRAPPVRTSAATRSTSARSPRAATTA
jgi:hypothetical protein